MKTINGNVNSRCLRKHMHNYYFILIIWNELCVWRKSTPQSLFDLVRAGCFAVNGAKNEVCSMLKMVCSKSSPIFEWHMSKNSWKWARGNGCQCHRIDCIYEFQSCVSTRRWGGSLFNSLIYLSPFYYNVSYATIFLDFHFCTLSHTHTNTVLNVIIIYFTMYRMARLMLKRHE